MDSPLINILIRTSNRPSGFARCLKSIVTQTYPNIRIIIGYDNEKALRYIPNGLEAIPMTADRSLPFFYDLYCNDLKARVTDGYFLFLDDDDILVKDILKDIPLTGDGLLVQLKRGTQIVPFDLNIRPAKVGMPCLILHHSLKNISMVTGTGVGDYFWIKGVLDKVKLPFVKMVVVYSFTRGFGKDEVITATGGLSIA